MLSLQSNLETTSGAQTLSGHPLTAGSACEKYGKIRSAVHEAEPRGSEFQGRALEQGATLALVE